MTFIVPYIIYPFDVLVCFVKSEKQFRKEYKKIVPEKFHNEIKECFKDHKFGNGNNARTLMLTSGQTVICMPEFEDTIEHQATLSHEIFHAVHFLMWRIGIKLKLSNGEAYSYLIQYLTSEIYKKINKYT